MGRFGVEGKHYPDGYLYRAYGPDVKGPWCEKYDEACGNLLDLYRASKTPLTDEESEDAVSTYEYVNDL